MSKITISDLRPAGADFFEDSESFMNDLDTDELSGVNGGFLPGLLTLSTAVCAVSISVVGTIGVLDDAGLFGGGIEAGKGEKVIFDSFDSLDGF